MSKRINPVTFDQKLEDGSFTVKTLIIGKAFAEEQNLNLVDFTEEQIISVDFNARLDKIHVNEGGANL